jgi:tetratricopeptide (TPR) repeat protein
VSKAEVNKAAAKFDKESEAAESALLELTKKEPRNVQAHLALGVTRLRLGKHKEAAESFRDALRAEANNCPAQVLLATALEQVRDYAGALTAWQAVAKADPTSKDAQERLANLGDLTGKPDVALDARRALVKLVPGSPEIVADLAVYLSRAKKHAEAVRMFERANSLSRGAPRRARRVQDFEVRRKGDVNCPHR